MSNDPYSGYVGHPVDTVKSALPHIFPGFTIELIVDGTNVAPGAKPKRLRVYYNKSTRLVSRIVAG